jgi:hypothetical protein
MRTRDVELLLHDPPREKTIMNPITSMPETQVPHTGRYQERPLTTEERIRDIERLLQRVTGYTEFMCRVRGLEGTSGEAREKALVAFHERIAALERQLGRIHEQFQLG